MDLDILKPHRARVGSSRKEIKTKTHVEVKSIAEQIFCA